MIKRNIFFLILIILLANNFSIQADDLLNLDDVSLFKQYYKTDSSSINWNSAKIYDFDNNNVINYDDLIYFAKSYGRPFTEIRIPIQIILASDTSVIFTGETIQLTVTAYYNDSTTQDIVSYCNWIYSADSFATTDTSGILSGLQSGTVVISATHNNIYSNTFIVTINDYLYPTGNEDYSLDQQLEQDMLRDRSVTLHYQDLPANIDYSEKMPIPMNQGITGTCTAWSAAYYYKTYQEVVEEGWNPVTNAFSPMFLFSVQSKIEKEGYRQAHNSITSYYSLKIFGCLKWDSMPFIDFNTSEKDYEADSYAAYITDTELEELMPESAIYKVGELKTVDTNSIKVALLDGPVILNILDYNYSHFGKSVSSENNYLTVKSGAGGGHAVLCVGYDDGKFGVGAIKFVNSWGSNWGENGYSWIKYQDIQYIISGAYQWEDLENSKPNAIAPTDRPKEVQNVIATTNLSLHVKITWDKLNDAKSYDIYRAENNGTDTFIVVGSAKTLKYIDRPPKPGTVYKYAVVGKNDFGISSINNYHNESKSYIDLGYTSGSQLEKPTLSYQYNDASGNSVFAVTDIDLNAKAFGLFISTTDPGAYSFLGYIEANSQFTIYWKTNNIFAGSKPFIKIISIGDNGYSDYSNAEQILTAVTTASVATVQNFVATPTSSTINLSWETSNTNYDYFQIFKYKSDINNVGEWEVLGYTLSKSYTDNYALVSMQYNYAIRAVYNGDYGEVFISDTVSIPSQKANLKLNNIVYYYGNIDTPTYLFLDVWNLGSTNIEDYEITIAAYDLVNDTLLTIGTIDADSVSASLPLLSGYRHTVSIQVNLGVTWTKIYYWVVIINPNETIEEDYYADNWKMSPNYWYISSQLSAAPKKRLAIKYKQDSFIGNTDPYAIISDKADLSAKRSIKKDISTRIIYKKPEFCFSKYHYQNE